jgi:hypothetical protein
MKTVFAILLLTASLVTQAQSMSGGIIDWTKTIRIGESTTYVVGGLADYEPLARYIKSKNPKIKLKRNWMAFGKVNAGLVLTINEKFFGCGCPQAFSEFFVFYDVESNKEGDDQISIDLLTSNHVLRQNSMTFKFGAESRLGMITTPDSKIPSFKAVSSDGAVDIEVSFDVGLDEIRYKDKMVDAGLHTLGGVSYMEGNRGVPLTPTFFRIKGPSKEYQNTFLFGTSKLRMDVNPHSQLGKLLEHIGFKPLAFIVRKMQNGLAWLPPQ